MNQVAEKLDQDKIEISAVLPKDIYLVWINILINF
jgi:hypothetical protein